MLEQDALIECMAHPLNSNSHASAFCIGRCVRQKDIVRTAPLYKLLIRAVVPLLFLFLEFELKYISLLGFRQGKISYFQKERVERSRTKIKNLRIKEDLLMHISMYHHRFMCMYRAYTGKRVCYDA